MWRVSVECFGKKSVFAGHSGSARLPDMRSDPLQNEMIFNMRNRLDCIKITDKVAFGRRETIP